MTEGVHPLFHCQINRRADPLKISLHIKIGEANHFQPILFQNCSPLLIPFDALLFIVLGTVQFYDQLCSMAIEVCNKVVDGFLPLKPHGIAAQKIVPEMIFLFGCALAQFFCTRDQFSLIWQ